MNAVKNLRDEVFIKYIVINVKMKIEKKYFEIPFDCMKDLIIEPCLKFNSNGMSINAFAEFNAAMVIFNLPKEKFIEYEFEDEERFKISSDLLSKIMKRIKTQFINLEFKNQKIIISDENKKEYAIAVMHDDEVERDMPQLELTIHEILYLENALRMIQSTGQPIGLKEGEDLAQSILEKLEEL